MTKRNCYLSVFCVGTLSRLEGSSWLPETEGVDRLPSAWNIRMGVQVLSNYIVYSRKLEN